MAASAQLFNKYIWLTDLIYSARKITFKEIDSRWQKSSLNEVQGSRLPLRTFHRWRNEIEEIFGICIECEKMTNSYYIWHAENLRTNMTQQWLLNTFAVTNMINESQSIQDNILLEDMPSDARFLTPIMEAMRNHTVLKVCYRKFTDSKEDGDIFIMRPYCVKAFKQRWYMVGESSKHPGEVRVYALDRILSMNFTEQQYTIPDNFDAKTYFHDYFGIMKGDSVSGEVLPEKVQIRVQAIGANYLRSLPLHHSQAETERNNEYSVFEFFIAPTFDFIQQLRTYGDELHVLQPQWLADKFRELGKKYVAMYA